MADSDLFVAHAKDPHRETMRTGCAGVLDANLVVQQRRRIWVAARGLRAHHLGDIYQVPGVIRPGYPGKLAPNRGLQSKIG